MAHDAACGRAEEVVLHAGAVRRDDDAVGADAGRVIDDPASGVALDDLGVYVARIRDNRVQFGEVVAGPFFQPALGQELAGKAGNGLDDGHSRDFSVGACQQARQFERFGKARAVFECDRDEDVVIHRGPPVWAVCEFALLYAIWSPDASAYISVLAGRPRRKSGVRPFRACALKMRRRRRAACG